MYFGYYFIETYCIYFIPFTFLQSILNSWITFFSISALLILHNLQSLLRYNSLAVTQLLSSYLQKIYVLCQSVKPKLMFSAWYLWIQPFDFCSFTLSTNSNYSFYCHCHVIECHYGSSNILTMESVAVEIEVKTRKQKHNSTELFFFFFIVVIIII